MKIILVVEDSPNVRKLMALYLKASGYGILEAGSGQEALLVLSSHRPDLVLLDHGLPDMTGLQVLRELKGRWPTIPVVLITGSDQEMIMNEWKDVRNPPKLLLKPVPMPVITTTVEQLLK